MVAAIRSTLLDADAPTTYFPHGRYRRRIRLVAPDAGTVLGGLEDDQHYFTVARRTRRRPGEHDHERVGARAVDDLSGRRRPAARRSSARRCRIGVSKSPVARSPTSTAPTSSTSRPSRSRTRRE